MLQRIADDRRNVQAKAQLAPKPEASTTLGHRAKGSAAGAGDGQCLLMVSLRSRALEAGAYTCFLFPAQR